jgi:hypothetical protein
MAAFVRGDYAASVVNVWLNPDGIAFQQGGRAGITVLRIAGPNRGGHEMAERVGFEPTRPLRAYTRSRRAPSTTRPSLRSFYRNAAQYTDNGRKRNQRQGWHLTARRGRHKSGAL